MIEEYIQTFANWFSMDNVLFEFLGQKVSLLECLSTFTGLLCVFLAVRAKVANFWIGYIYNVFLFVMFYQLRLYSSMILHKGKRFPQSLLERRCKCSERGRRKENRSFSRRNEYSRTKA